MGLKQQISSNIKRLRGEAGLSQQKLAERTGLQVRYLSQLENHPKDISTRTLERLAIGLGVTAAELIEGSEKPSEPALPRKMAAGLDEAIRILQRQRALVK